MRPLLLAVFFIAVVASSITLMVVLVVPGIPDLLGVSVDGPASLWRALATIGIAILLVFGALYAGGLVWLFLACHMFTREEVEQILKVGPNTRLELWILDRFSR